MTGQDVSGYGGLTLLLVPKEFIVSPVAEGLHGLTSRMRPRAAGLNLCGPLGEHATNSTRPMTPTSRTWDIALMDHSRTPIN